MLLGEGANSYAVLKIAHLFCQTSKKKNNASSFSFKFHIVLDHPTMHSCYFEQIVDTVKDLTAFSIKLLLLFMIHLVISQNILPPSTIYFGCKFNDERKPSL